MDTALIVFDLSNGKSEDSLRDRIKDPMGPLFVYNKVSSQNEIQVFDGSDSNSLSEVASKSLNKLRSLSVREYIHNNQLDVADQPCCIIIGEVWSPILTNTYQELVDFFADQNIDTQIVVKYGSEEPVDDLTFWKASFFMNWNEYLRRNKNSIIDHCRVWLLDMTNEEEIYLEKNSHLDRKISELIELIASNKVAIDRNSIAGQSVDNLTLFLSFGFCSLKFPVSEIQKYLLSQTYVEELSALFKREKTQFERIKLKGDLDRFYNKYQFSKVDQLISSGSDEKSLFVPFAIPIAGYFENVKEATTKRQLRAIDDVNISAVNTINIISKVDKDFGKYKSSEAFYEQGGRLDSRKKEIENEFVEIINEEVSHKLTDENGGVVYAMVFASLLRDDETSVNDYLTGALPGTFTTLSTVLADQREWFIGNDINKLQRELDAAERTLTNNNERVKKLTKEVDRLGVELGKLESLKGKETPDFIVKSKEKEAKEKEIAELKESFSDNKAILERIKTEIDQLIKSFENDSFRMTLKDTLEQEYVQKSEDLKERLSGFDNDLLLAYQKKNELISKRRKTLTYWIAAFPITAVIVTICLSLLLSWYSITPIKYPLYLGSIATAGILLYGVFVLVKLRNELIDLLRSIKSTLNDKETLFSRYISSLNDNLEFNFKWDCHVIGYEMIKDVKSYIDVKFDKLTGFYEALAKKKESVVEQSKSTRLCDSINDFSAVELPALRSFYKTHRSNNLLGKEGYSLDKYFVDFEETEAFLDLDNDLSQDVDRIFQTRLNEITINDILQNTVREFETTRDAEKDLKFLYKNSRSMLMTKRASPQSPYSVNVGGGSLESNFVSLLNENKESHVAEINWELNSDGHYVKLINIKSNFLDSAVYDFSSNHELFLSSLNVNTSSKYIAEGLLMKDSVVGYYDEDIEANPMYQDDLMMILLGFYFKQFSLSDDGKILYEDKIVAWSGSQLINYLRTPSGKNAVANIVDLEEKYLISLGEKEYSEFSQEMKSCFQPIKQIFNETQINIIEASLLSKAEM